MKSLLIVSLALLVSFVLLSISGRAQSSSTACYSQAMLTDKMAAEIAHETPCAITTGSQVAASKRLDLPERVAEAEDYNPDYGKRVRSTVRTSAGPVTKPVHPEDIPCTKESTRAVANLIDQTETY